MDTYVETTDTGTDTDVSTATAPATATVIDKDTNSDSDTDTPAYQVQENTNGSAKELAWLLLSRSPLEAYGHFCHHQLLHRCFQRLHRDGVCEESESDATHVHVGVSTPGPHYLVPTPPPPAHDTNTHTNSHTTYMHTHAWIIIGFAASFEDISLDRESFQNSRGRVVLERDD